MKKRAVLAMAVAALAAPITTAPIIAAPIAAGASASTSVDQPVIVVLRSAARGPVRAAVQAPLLSELRSTSARNVHAYTLVDAVSATVSAAEEARLAANPNVVEVVPDSPVRGPASPVARAAAGTPQPLPAPPGACPAPGQPAYVGEELSLIHADSNDPAEPTARSLGFTGTGVKVAFMAEGIDTNNPDFIRPDGSHVFVDYQDFSGDGTSAPTSGGEAFLDASAIASQGKQYDISHFGQDPLSRPCRISVEGVAPGASLVGLKVFAQNGYSTTSALVQAVDYAVTVDHVDVLNESLGYNPFPTTQSQDLLERFNDAAVAAGTTVTVAAGDAGPANTIGSPDTDPLVINLGASTDYRFYADTGGDGYVPPIATKGWLSDNISGLSSGGVEQSGPTDDAVAPGDLSFAACTPDPAMYSNCVNLAGKASPVELSGGTSESSPLAAGTAALVIQAYRSSHHGASPTPARVKQVIVSTADDLGHPATEQGSGLVDAYRAVLAAESLPGGRTGAPSGNQVLLSTAQLHATALPGTPETWPLKVTNLGAGPSRLTLSTRTLGKALDTVTGAVTLADGGPRFFNNLTGLESNYRTIHFDVAPGRERLIAETAYQGNPANSFLSAVDLVLIDPEGNFAEDSDPQGVGNADRAEVRYPAAGTWTALIFSPTAARGGTTGPVQFRAQTFDFRPLGTVVPATLDLPAGGSATVEVHGTTPSTPGDETGAVLVSDPAGQTSSAVLTMRSLVNLATGGAFSGTLTGGNGRQSDLGQVAYLQWQVPAGEEGKTLVADVTLAGHATDPVLAYLVDPGGQTLATATNRVATAFGKDGPKEAPTSSVEVTATSPPPGLWTLVLNFAPALTGDRVSTPYSGAVQLADQPASADGLPDSRSFTLERGHRLLAYASVTNTSKSPLDYFADARLESEQSIALAPQSPADLSLPMRAGAASPSWLVPQDTRSVTVDAQSPDPVTFDYGPGIGDPDLGATTAGDTAAGTWNAEPVSAGLWFADPSLIGPYGSQAPQRAHSKMFASVVTQAFDQAVSTSTGDLWLQPSSLSILKIEPGQTGLIPVTITPGATKGTVVTGTLYVDELSEIPASAANALNFQPAQSWFPDGAQVAALPYEYRVG